MRKLTALVLALALLAVAPIQAAQPAPDWQLVTADGSDVRLETEVQEQVVILFFWATWCPYCKALMPHLQSIRLEYGDAVKILAINFREKDDPVAYLRDKGYDFTILPDGDEVAALYRVWATPGVIIVDGSREIVFDLRALPPYEMPLSAKKFSHAKNAAFRAPYWAAAIRQHLDKVILDAGQ